jgi:hypothetical protein
MFKTMICCRFVSNYIKAMKTSNILLIAVGAALAYFFMKYRTKKVEGVLVNPTLTVPNNPRVTPPNTIDPPSIILAKAAPSMLPERTLTGRPLMSGPVDDAILASARSQGIAPSALVKARML